MMLIPRLHMALFRMESRYSIRYRSCDESRRKKWRNSASVRIPASITVKITEYDLADLLAGITPENGHPEVDFGVPVGGERL